MRLRPWRLTLFALLAAVLVSLGQGEQRREPARRRLRHGFVGHDVRPAEAHAHLQNEVPAVAVLGKKRMNKKDDKAADKEEGTEEANAEDGNEEEKTGDESEEDAAAEESDEADEGDEAEAEEEQQSENGEEEGEKEAEEEEDTREYDTFCDDKEGWADSEGFSCKHYEEFAFCTDSGNVGENWIAAWGGLDAFAVEGVDAHTACCACGGGNKTKVLVDEEEEAEGEAEEEEASEDEEEASEEQETAEEEEPHLEEGETVCFDDPETWTDAAGYTCKDYENTNWCTEEGGYGTGWFPFWGSFSDHAKDGRGANDACCACGGGKLLVCTGACRVAMNWAVKRVRDHTAHLAKHAVEAGVAEARDAWLQALAGEEEDPEGVTGGLVTEETERLAGFSEGLREEALEDARERFDKITKHRDELPEAAEHNLTFTGYLAVREAASDSNLVDSARLHDSALDVARGYKDAASLWGTARDYGEGAAQRGWRTWRRSYANVTHTWEAVSGSIHAVNQASEDLLEPFSATRWSEQTVHLSQDLASLATKQAKDLEQQVAGVEHQTEEATRVTQVNSDMLEQVKRMVHEVDVKVKRAESAAAR